MPLPENWQTIGAYLLSHGYGLIATAGILGNIEQESGGNPEAKSPDGGGGIIQWTPYPPDLVTGNPSADLQRQLPAMIQYNNAQGPLALQKLHNAKTPAQAATTYMQLFERPAIGPSDGLQNRIQSANEVFGHLSQGAIPSPGPLPFPFDLIPGLGGAGSGLQSGFTILGDVANPEWWKRIGKGAIGGALVIVGFYVMIRHTDTVEKAESTVKKAGTEAALAAAK